MVQVNMLVEGISIQLGLKAIHGSIFA